MFNSVGDLFSNGDFQKARPLYQALFDLLEEAGETDYVLPELVLDVREVRARFARSVYEAAEDAMDLDAGYHYNRQEVHGACPLFQDVMDTREGPGKRSVIFWNRPERIVKISPVC